MVYCVLKWYKWYSWYSQIFNKELKMVTKIDLLNPASLAVQVRRAIQRNIKSGKYKVDEKLPSERELAEIYQVSRMTVRESMVALTQQGVLVRRVGKGSFIADPNRRQNFGKKLSHIIGLAVFDIGLIIDPYFSKIISGISTVLNDKGYRLQWTTAKENISGKKREFFFITQAKNKHMDGLLILDQYIADAKILELEATGIPFVLIDRSIKDRESQAVLVDNEKGIFEATKHLIEKGHKEIVFILESRKYYKSREMLKGHKRALKKYNLSYNDALVQEVNNVDIEKLLNSPSQPTAIVSSSDKVALIMLQMVKGKGLKVPDDIAITGYNDEPISSATDPQLTTMQVPLEEMGEKAVELLLKLISGEKPGEPYPMLEPRLIIRDSA